jgi:hypothetical protein
MDMTQSHALTISRAFAALPSYDQDVQELVRDQLERVALAWRDDLADPVGGDRELEWWSGPGRGSVLLARGYDDAGTRVTFDLRNAWDCPIVAWDGELARELLTLGHDGTLTLNTDAEGDELEALLAEQQVGSIVWQHRHRLHQAAL